MTTGHWCLTILLLAVGVAFAIEANTHYVGRIIDNVVYDNVDHYTPCRDLPTFAEVESAIRAHRDVIDRITQVNPRSVEIEIGAPCPDRDRADLIIYYQGHADRVEIEAVIGSSTFFGIPYRLRNT